MSKRMYLIFENGSVFEGKSFGAEADTVGELVFTTGVCGYADTLTDKSYCGQIVMQTFPMIGNYGINAQELTMQSFVKGYVVREWCENPSNFRSEATVDEFLKAKGITGIYGVDTRTITKLIRENGSMNAMIASEVPADLSVIKNYKITDALKAVSGEKAVYKADNEEKYRVTLIDYGTKANVIEALNAMGCTVTAVSYNASYDEILSTNPDGIVLSEGPGNPAEYTEQTATIKKLFGKLPILGIALGHQLLAIACGGKTEKLPYGHRGGSQPVKDFAGRRTYITEQNHGYTVLADTVQSAKISFLNANDCTCEGLEYPDSKAISVQFSIDTSSGPHDTSFIYKKFISLMEGK